jgi:hypothetical protein
MIKLKKYKKNTQLATTEIITNITSHKSIQNKLLNLFSNQFNI